MKVRKDNVLETQPVSGTVNVGTISGSVSLPTGASTLAEQQTQTTKLDAIKTAVETIDNAIAGTEMQVDVLTMPVVQVGDNGGSLTIDATSLPLPTGAATLAEQQTQTTALGTLDTSVNTLLKPASTLTAVTTVGTITNVVHVDDNAGSLTVDGTVSAKVQDGSGNAVTSHSAGASRGIDVSIIDGSGNQITSFGGGTQYTEDSAAAADPVGTAPILVRADTPATITSTDGDNVAQRGTNYGAAYVQVVSSTGAFVDTFGGGTQYADGAARGTATGTLAMGDDGTNIQSVKVNSSGELQVGVVGTVPVTDNGGSLTIDATSLPLPTGAATSAKQDTGNTSLASIDTWIQDIDGYVSATMDVAASTRASEATAADIKTSVQLIDDAIATTGSAVPTKANFIAGTDGTNARALKTDASGELQIDVLSSALPSGAATSALQSTIDTSINTLLKPASTLSAVTTVGTITNVVHVDDNASTLSIDDGGGSITIDGTVAVSGTVTADTELPAAAALADATANPSTTSVGALGLLYNGTTWDRMRGDTTNGLDVDVTRVSGNVTVIQGTGTNLHTVIDSGTITSITNSVAVTDNAGSLTVDNAGTFAVQDSQVVTDNGGFTDGTTKLFAAGYVFDETAGTALTENDAAAARVDSKRAQVLVIEDATTRGQRATVASNGAVKTDGTVVLATGSITTQNLVPAGTATAGSAVEATITTQGMATVQVTGTYTGALSLQYTVDGTTWVTHATGNDAAFFNVNAGTYAFTIASGTTGIFRVPTTGAVKIRITALAAVTGTATVTINAVNAAIPGPSSQNINQNLVGGATITVNNGTAGSGTQRVVIASDQTAYSVIATGSVADDSPASGNPVPIGLTARQTNRTAVTDGDVVRQAADDIGRAVMVVGQVRDLMTHQHTQIASSSAETTILSAGAAGVFHDLTQLVLTNQTATAVNCTLKDATAGTTRMIIALAANGGAVIPFHRPLTQAAAANNWTITLSSAAVTVNILAQAEKNV